MSLGKGPFEFIHLGYWPVGFPAVVEGVRTPCAYLPLGPNEDEGVGTGDELRACRCSALGRPGLMVVSRLGEDGSGYPLC